jgi:hypothetical protein
MGNWAVEQGWKTGYTAVTDFIAGHDAEAAFTKSFTDAGGKIVAADRFSLANPISPRSSTLRLRRSSPARSPSDNLARVLVVQACSPRARAGARRNTPRPRRHRLLGREPGAS